MNRRLALAIVIVTISVFVLTLCVRTVKSDPYIDEQAASVEVLVLLMILGAAVLGVAIVSLVIVFLVKHRRR